MLSAYSEHGRHWRSHEKESSAHAALCTLGRVRGTEARTACPKQRCEGSPLTHTTSATKTWGYIAARRCSVHTHNRDQGRALPPKNPEGPRPPDRTESREKHLPARPAASEMQRTRTAVCVSMFCYTLMHCSSASPKASSQGGQNGWQLAAGLGSLRQALERLQQRDRREGGLRNIGLCAEQAGLQGCPRPQLQQSSPRM